MNDGGRREGSSAGDDMLGIVGAWARTTHLMSLPRSLLYPNAGHNAGSKLCKQ